MIKAEAHTRAHVCAHTVCLDWPEELKASFIARLTIGGLIGFCLIHLITFFVFMFYRYMIEIPSLEKTIDGRRPSHMF